MNERKKKDKKKRKNNKNIMKTNWKMLPLKLFEKYFNKFYIHMKQMKSPFPLLKILMN